MSIKTVIALLLGACLLLVACDDDPKPKEGCGNGLLDLGEECDGGALQDATCAGLGFYRANGVLACSADCRYDVSDCGGRCGDGAVDATDGEACDGVNLSGESCQSLGYAGGVLTCGAACSFDMSGCTSTCGDGIIEGGETCDDGNAFGMDGCSSTCTVETGWECEGTPSDCTSICGDDLLAGDEDCDGDDLAGETCETLGYYGGVLACANDCTLDLASCESFGRCGDGVIQEEYAEACEGTDLQEQTCEFLGYNGGNLACLADCTLDLAECEAAGRCGDGIVQQAFEECEISDLDGQTCMTLGFVSGSLACDGSCGFDSSGCMLNYESPNIGTLIYVPAGTFQRDSTATNQSVVSAFRMSKYEITRAQWTAVTGWADPSVAAYSSGTSDPVQIVSWYDAIAFCNKLSIAEGLTPVYTVSGVDFTTLTYAQIPTSDNATWNAATANWAANGYRLPTEMEWMWAAMGADTANPGVTNTTGYSKAFAGSTGSNLIGDYAVFGYIGSETGRTTTQRTNPVGSKLANELGFHDLSGNVWEWTWDGYGTYPTGTVTDYRGPASGSNRVMRGGNWFNAASNCTVADRGHYFPYNRNYDIIGFRVVRN